jgi:glyoxylase-like metal-dependent hydrolase (beta-lactamase superfamily II)
MCARVTAVGQATALSTIPSWRRELRRLAPNVYAYTQASGPGVNNASLSNAGLIVGPDHLLAIDTPGPPVHAKAFRAAATKGTGKFFGRVINTHHHRDHTNGNYLYAPLEIVAHDSEPRPPWVLVVHDRPLSAGLPSRGGAMRAAA